LFGYVDDFVGIFLVVWIFICLVKVLIRFILAVIVCQCMFRGAFSTPFIAIVSLVQSSLCLF